MADADGARDEARRILEGDRYRPRDVPRPLQGVLRWMGDRLRDVAEPVRDLLSTPAGIAVGLTVVAALAVLAAATAARRRNRTVDHAAARCRRDRGEDPGALDRDAEAAEEAGDLALALRLRFRAGLLRLQAAGALPVRADTTSRRLVAAVPAPGLEDLAVTFDEVVYGGRPAGPDDVAAARRLWPEVVAGAHRSVDPEAGPESRP